MLPHPTNASILYLGTVNGGIWKTTRATSASPPWVPLTDNLYSLSIGAMAFDYTDKSYNTIVAGYGSQSSDSRLGGLHLGVLRTTDGGKNWDVLGTDSLYGYRISGIYASGSTISICAVGYGLEDSQNFQNGATFYSVDSGETWSPYNSESCTDMRADRTVDGTVFRAGLSTGITISRDSGVSWSPSIFPKLSTSFPGKRILNIRLAVKNIGTSKSPKFLIYAGFLSSNALEGLYRGVQVDKNEFNWSKLDLPSTVDNGVVTGIFSGLNSKPGSGQFAKPGGQGLIYFSIAMDTNATDIVYLGGDRQPTGGTSTDPSWPNSIGATTFDGRLFRCNASLPSGSQCTPLTHTYAAQNSAPHADSRDLAVDASGRLLEADDGGIYSRSNPLSTLGQWFSLNNNLTIQEAQSVAYLGKNIFITGNQDTGTTYGAGNSSTAWNSLGVGSGGVVRSGRMSDGSRIAYWSGPYLQGFSSTVFESSGTVRTTVARGLTIAGTNNSLQDWVSGVSPSVSFYQDFVVNSIDPKRVLFALSLDQFLFESDSNGETLTPIPVSGSPPGQIGTGAAVYGGIYMKTSYPDVAYVSGLNLLALRDIGATGSNWTMTNYPPIGMRWPTIAHIAVHPQSFSFVAVLGKYGEVAYSKNFGHNWDILPRLNVGVSSMADSEQLRIAIIPGPVPRFVVAGRTGVYVYQEKKSTWWRIATQTGAYVSDMVYDAAEDILIISTLGRSVWSFPSISKSLSDYDFEHSKPTASYVRPPKVPNWQILTFVFAALTVVLFLSTLVFAVAFLTTKLRDEGSEDSQLLVNETPQ